ncbi:hypothetical protein KQI63_05885 [bacterium]|nr:hypothetical protein [bacterium]
MSQVTLYHGDGISLLKSIPAETVQVVHFDGPYGMEFRSNRRATRKGSIANDRHAQARELHCNAFPEVKRILLPGGSWFVWTQLAARNCWSVAPLIVASTPNKTGRRDTEHELQYEGMITWNKVHWGTGWTWRRQSEQCLHFFKPDSNGAPTFTRSNLPDVISYPRMTIGEDEHAAEKPTKVINHLLNPTTEMGCLVVDPVMGHGVAVEVAWRLGCQVIGGDIELESVETTAERLTRLGASVTVEAL